MALVRLNISTSEDVREWFKVQAEEYGMSMSALMSFVLTQYKKNEESRELLKDLSQISSNMDTGKLLDDVKMLMDTINADNPTDLPSIQFERE